MKPTQDSDSTHPSSGADLGRGHRENGASCVAEVLARCEVHEGPLGWHVAMRSNYPERPNATFWGPTPESAALALIAHRSNGGGA